MFIIKSVVGKLWMTIIGLVAVVLIILGFFLFRYIDTSFPNVSNQEENLLRLANKIASEASAHHNDNPYFEALSELLETQDSGMKLLERGAISMDEPLFMAGDKMIKLKEVLKPEELEAAFAGETIRKRFSVSMNPWHGGYVYVAMPLYIEGQAEPYSVMIVYQSMQSVEDTQVYVKRLFALVSLMGFLLTTFFAFFLITRITKPLTELKKAADSIIYGQYDKRVPPVSNDEIGELTQTFNLMADRLQGTIKDLNHEKQNLASVLHSMEDAVISFDPEGNIIFINPHGEMMMEDWNGLDWDEQEEDAMAPYKGHIPDPLRQLFNEVVKETKGISSRLHVKNGVWSVVMAPLYSEEQVRGVVAVIRDVTEETRLEKLRTDFVANVSHELRTPLSMLQGYSEALVDDIAASPEERKELAQVIHDESLRMGRLVKDLLDLARMENGHMEMNLREVNIMELIQRVQRKFLVLSKDQGIRLETDLRCHDLVLRSADEDRLEQVLTNLLDNAIRHSSEGSTITLRCDKAEYMKASAVRIQIEDEGEGIPPDALPYIFERFYKADKARTRGAAGGTGLGLAIVKNIVDAHRGTISATSTVGQGTTFSILLPTES